MFQEFKEGIIIEEEDHPVNYIYFTLRGQVSMYKRPESMYTDANERIRCDNIDNFINPKDAGQNKIGVINGFMEAPSWIAEDAFILN